MSNCTKCKKASESRVYKESIFGVTRKVVFDCGKKPEDVPYSWENIGYSEQVWAWVEEEESFMERVSTKERSLWNESFKRTRDYHLSRFLDVPLPENFNLENATVEEVYLNDLRSLWLTVKTCKGHMKDLLEAHPDDESKEYANLRKLYTDLLDDNEEEKW